MSPAPESGSKIEPTTGPIELSRSPATAYVFLAIFIPVGAWLVWEIERTIGLNAPRFWELLKGDRVFDFAMLDFFMTAGYAGLVLFGRANRRDWRSWASLALFCVIPSLGIAMFILVQSRRDSGLSRPIQ